MEAAKRAKFDEETISAVILGKAFHLYTRRNEWVNWDGDTDVVSRAGKTIRISLSDAEQRAERLRIQGTQFIINELPIICLQTASGAMIVTEIFSERPMLGYIKQSPLSLDCTSIGALFRSLALPKWSIIFPIEGLLSISSLDGIYYSRTSSSGKGNSHLGWSLKPRTIDDTAIRKLADDIKSILNNTTDA